MALTITYPNAITPAFNPVLITATSTVRDDYTIGSAKTITSITQSGGFCVLNFSAGHSLLKGDFVLITSAPGSEEIIGVGLVTQIIDSNSLKINIPFVASLTSNGTAYKYIANYSCVVDLYVYYNSAPSTAVYIGQKIQKPKFVGGFCYFEIDVASIIKSYNFKQSGSSEVLSWDLYEYATTGLQINTKSFVKWGVELAEGFDNPSGGVPEWQGGVSPA